VQKSHSDACVLKNERVLAKICFLRLRVEFLTRVLVDSTHNLLLYKIQKYRKKDESWISVTFHNYLLDI
jgi:hypothetical protein